MKFLFITILLIGIIAMMLTVMIGGGFRLGTLEVRIAHEEAATSTPPAEKPPASTTQKIKNPPMQFHGPTGAPHIIGPSSGPPNR